MKQKTELLQIRIDKELLEDLKELSDSNSLSVSSQVRMLIKNTIDGRRQ